VGFFGFYWAGFLLPTLFIYKDDIRRPRHYAVDEKKTDFQQILDLNTFASHGFNLSITEPVPVLEGN
jgi:hypothetical protein